MKKFIVGLHNDWIAFLFAVMGILLIIFPKEFTGIVPYVLGIGLIIKGVVCIVAIVKHYETDTDIRAGRIVMYLVLGSAILYHNAEAIGPIGAIWAMMSLNEVSEEITEDFENHSFSLVRSIFAVITIALAVMLMFDPFEHFSVHIGVLGAEMISSCFIRKRGGKKEKDEA